MTLMTETNPYKEANTGSLKGIRRWQAFDDFWQKLETLNDGQWFIYDTTKNPPTETVSKAAFTDFLTMTNQLLHEQHQEDYCGIVYVDNMDEPRFIKIYDPANLGVVCGFSDNPPLPGWIISRLTPCDLHKPAPPSLWKKYLHKFK